MEIKKQLTGVRDINGRELYSTDFFITIYNGKVETGFLDFDVDKNNWVGIIANGSNDRVMLDSVEVWRSDDMSPGEATSISRKWHTKHNNVASNTYS